MAKKKPKGYTPEDLNKALDRLWGAAQSYLAPNQPRPPTHFVPDPRRDFREATGGGAVPSSNTLALNPVGVGPFPNDLLPPPDPFTHLMGLAPLHKGQRDAFIADPYAAQMVANMKAGRVGFPEAMLMHEWTHTQQVPEAQRWHGIDEEGGAALMENQLLRTVAQRLHANIDPRWQPRGGYDDSYRGYMNVVRNQLGPTFVSHGQIGLPTQRGANAPAR